MVHPPVAFSVRSIESVAPGEDATGAATSVFAVSVYSACWFPAPATAVRTRGPACAKRFAMSAHRDHQILIRPSVDNVRSQHRALGERL